MKIDPRELPDKLEFEAQLCCDLADDKDTGKLLVMAASEIRKLREWQSGVIANAHAHHVREDEVKELRELVRSACAIADRKGEGTAWNRFKGSAAKLGLNGITARTYRKLPDDTDEA